MSVEAEDDVRLARLDATLSEDSRYAYVKHVYYGWKKDEGEEYVWRRTYKPIGSGGFGAVYREECVEGRDKGNQRAVKILPKPATLDTRRIDISRELEAIARFSRPEFAQFFVSSQGWYEDTTSIFIVMELLPLGNLQQYIGSALPETECKLITAQILQGLAYLHRDGYVHRDLKPQNLLVVQRGPTWHIKLADFGLTKSIAEELSSLHTIAGTPGYMAPELLGLDVDSDDSDDSGDERHRSYTSAVDIWAVGTIAFQLLAGILPFPSSDQRALRKYVKGKTSFPVDTLRSKKIASGLIERLMAPRPAARPSAETSLQCSWFAPPQSGPPFRTSMRPPNDSSSVAESVPSAKWTNNDSGYSSALPAQQMEPFHLTTLTASPILQASSSISNPEVKDLGPLLEGGTLQNAMLSPDGESIAVQWDRPDISDFVFDYWDVERRAKAGRVKLPKTLSILGWSSDRRLVAFELRVHGSPPFAVSLWDAARGAEVTRLPRHHARVWCVVFSPGGTLIALGPGHGPVQLRDAVSGVLIRELKFSEWASAIVFSPDGKLIAARLSGRITLWDTATGCKMKTLIRSPVVDTVAFSPDGRRVIASGKFGWMSLWDVSSEFEIKTLPNFNVNVHGMAFSPDGQFVACRGERHKNYDMPNEPTSEMLVCNLLNGTELRPLFGWPKVQLFDLAFLPDGRLAAVAGGADRKSCSIYFWTISSANPSILSDGENKAENRITELL